MAAAKTDTGGSRAGSQVVATAGHVDHGKSSLINRLTGMDPDRFAEEKRRGLTIDLGYAWCELPSGREIGFVDVPGHEKFVHNMLAGVGPVRIVLFIVAADEGWKPQSEEHLAILDILGIDEAVIALTKTDLLDDPAQIDVVAADIARRLAGTALEGSPIVPVSSKTGEGLDALRDALDTAVSRATAGAEPAEAASGANTRPRLFVDRVFSIKGAGTVVTGTLAGGSLHTGDDVELNPGRRRARIRGLQTHKHQRDDVTSVSRVAVNLSGIDRSGAARGDVLGLPGQWRTTRTFEGTLRPVRGLDHEITSKGAFKLYAGASETPVKLRIFQGGVARFRLAAPIVVDVFDHFVLRDDGRGLTVGGGIVLDVDPPRRSGPHPVARLETRRMATREDLPLIVVGERGAVRVRDILPLTGVQAGQPAGTDWVFTPELLDTATQAVTAGLKTFHAEHPLAAGEDIAAVRATILDATRVGDESLADALLGAMQSAGDIEREEGAIRLPTHQPQTADREQFAALVEAVGTEPPVLRELTAQGFSRDLIDSAVAAGVLVRVSPDYVMTADFVARAQSFLETDALEGITVSTFRERMNTSRKYAIPMLEYFDNKGVTRREGDMRIARPRS